MDSEVKQPSSISERVWNAAEQKGAERRAKFQKTMNRIFGLPEAAVELTKIGGEMVKTKVEEIKDKAIALKERTETKVRETRERLVGRYESTRDNLVSRIEAFRNKVKDKAIELKNRAVKAGIKAGYNIEEKISKILELPAEIKEARAGKLAEKVSGREKTKEQTMAELFAEKNGLNEDMKNQLEHLLMKQREELQEMLESQNKVKGMQEEEHKGVVEKMDKGITAGKEKITKLQTEATLVREKVEKRKVFKGMLEKIK